MGCVDVDIRVGGMVAVHLRADVEVGRAFVRCGSDIGSDPFIDPGEADNDNEVPTSVRQ